MAELEYQIDVSPMEDSAWNEPVCLIENGKTEVANLPESISCIEAGDVNVARTYAIRGKARINTDQFDEVRIYRGIAEDHVHCRDLVDTILCSSTI